jgi:dihydroorotate dehydrogenase
VYRLVFEFVLRHLPTEFVHHFSVGVLRLVMAIPLLGNALARWLRPSDPRLRVRAFGLDFPGPVGLAAGFDKGAVAYHALEGLGFGFVEIGTVTALAQPGNPRPRLFRLPLDRALVNRMGFNNDGADAVAPRLLGARRGPLGVNIGKSKVVPKEQAVADYVASTERLARHADYFVVNVSSPNTPGLRDLQVVSELEPLLGAVRATLDRVVTERHVPLLVKIAPDLSDADVDAIADLALVLKLDGVIATNTTLSREGLATPAEAVAAIGAGGLSGAPLKGRSLHVLRRLRARVGSKLTLIAAGGIETPEDAWERLCAGASLLQIYTGFIYGGPLTPRRLHRGLLAKLEQGGFDSLERAIGRAAPSYAGDRSDGS